MRSATVITISDRASAGSREDESGPALVERLVALGFDCDTAVVADQMEDIAMAVARASESSTLVVTTGGTGLGPRDRTPQTLAVLLDYEIPGFGEAMRAAGRRSTPMADLSRSLAGVMGKTLVVAVPGSRSGAVESLSALEPLLGHALETLAGQTEHHEHETGEG